ncbi:hypothetical protein ABB37_05096 [Leptomonas pyrrhocoris]|uniref:Uncharacterized protein n=1 Tax=Leptomonas pyrrhocoris TaxID=157538 RepID=A0A0M9G0X8_LEPPY|nr:hypothetical protein ABB37_05096 [Leptomonas pyrrhocoris]XP_015658534.1 hypothetical protein ABB37_05096 [Leptomonas pyrrhocoris]KPA80094.1 hypothetical protein ABB37_05096 [Leptomonas pyrrhocoris]KPA80095.1 hypothetical protein ABB37_05096 [Leptomonas pyrrhocoris]|eukprot:XP_015658533.1 hypothetical protein ABB37_05096 [Leptomonas pyrrhocoris]
MRRAMRRIPADAPQQNNFNEISYVSLSDADEERDGGDLIRVLVLPESPRPMESRMVHRIRAELHRMERLGSLRAMIAKRTIVAALRAWIHRFRTSRQGGSLTHSYMTYRKSVLSRNFRHTEAEMMGAEAGLCTVQAMLRAQHSKRCSVRLRDEQQRRRAATAIQRAWRRCPHRNAYIRRVLDAHARAVLCRHESLERRDMLRRHMVFLVRCHQQLYNDPCMWEAGLAIRRLPLYTADGLFLSDVVGSYVTGPMQLLAASTLRSENPLNEDAGVPSPLATIPTALRFTGFSSSAVVAAEQGGNRFSDALQPIRDMPKTDAWWGDDELDVDAELRYCQYRLFFSPEDRRLLEEAAEGNPEMLAALSFSMDAAESRLSTLGFHSKRGEGGTVLPGQQQPPPLPLQTVEDKMPYSKAFASALSFLRQPPAVDPAVQGVRQQLEAARRDPAQLLRVLCTYGHLSSELVAPFTCYGLHYQNVARGVEDQAVLSSTAIMQTCEPLVTGVAANPAEELRHCLVGVGVRKSSRSGAGAGGAVGLPLPLLEYQCRREAARGRGGATDQMGDKWLMPLASAPAALQRSGFANLATQALFHGVERAAPTADTGVTPDNTTTTSEVRNNAAGDELAKEWDHRLAAGTGEIGAAWRQFLLSISASTPADFASSRNRNAKMQLNERTETALKAAPDVSPSAPMQDRRFVGLCSHLAAPTSPSTSLLLRDFEPTGANFVKDEENNDVTGAALHEMSSAAAPVVNAAPCRSLKVKTTGNADAPITLLRAEEWWDAVARLLIQERSRRLSLGQNECEKRRSIGILRRLTPH